MKQEKFQHIFNTVFFRNKYLITIILFIIWVALFDSNNFINRYKLIQNLNELEKDKRYYIEKIKQDSIQLQELKTNKQKLEKFAREHYFMKKENEDIFVIVEESNNEP